MNIPVIPERIDGWTLEIIDALVEIRDIESETFDFKKDIPEDFHNDICAMANWFGGYLVLGIDEIHSTSDPNVIIRFNKTGFKGGKEDVIAQQISNHVYNVEPLPKVEYIHIQEKNNNNRFYTVLKITSEDSGKPYFLKNGMCYVRIGNTTKPATRSVILNLAMNKIVSRDEIIRHTNYLKEIYRKFTAVRPARIYGLLTLEVPTSYEDYVKSLNAVLLSSVTHTETHVSATFRDFIDITHSNWAISHLLTDPEYANMNKNWQDLIELRSEYKEIANSIKSKIDALVADSMKQHYPEFKEVADIKTVKDNCYSVSNVSETVSARMINNYDDSDKIPDFDVLSIEKLNDDYFVVSQYPIIRSRREEDLNIDQIRSILQTPFKSIEIKNQRKELDRIFGKAYYLCNEFSKQLKSLIDDFNGGDVIKGRCKLGF